VVPRPVGAARPGAVLSPNHLLQPLQVIRAEASVLRRSAAGPAANDGPHASLRHGYRPSPKDERPPSLSYPNPTLPTAALDLMAVFDARLTNR
jgi:hypothetical protein